MSSSPPPVNVQEEHDDVMEHHHHHHQKEQPDFFSFFFTPPREDGVVNFGSSITSSIRQPIQGVASAMLGGIFAVVDTALAVLNEEFNAPEDSLMSSSSNSSDVDEQFATNKPGHDDEPEDPKSNRCRRNLRSNTAEMGLNANLTLKEDAGGGNDKHVSGLSDSDDMLLRSIVGSVSKLELHEDFEGKQKKEECIRTKIVCSIQDDLFCNPEKKDDSEYCIVENERETDGWLVVNDDQ